ncbi:MAG TPA: branched-chain amino acid ABC transporter substrate-binding protein [Gaiellaceae bacterium]|nr:branched-chain amino acid ABC transporter substrate-binding protein [Gaiellaceae bacterium]
MKLRLTVVAMPVLAIAIVAAAFAASNASAVRTSAGTAQIACGTTRTIGVAYPATGPAASIGSAQFHWAQFFVKRWNALKANAKQKIAIVQGDTQLGVDTAFAVKVAQSFASNPKVLGVVGPAGSQEVVASTSALKGAGLGFVSGSASRVSLTDGHTDGVNRQGYFFRTVPNDDNQGPTVANYMRLKLKVQRVYVIDDQETYSQGLADNVQANLKAHGISVTRDSVSQTTTDFSSLIAKIPGNTQVIYIPWQLSPRAQAFGQQLKAAGKNITLFGSDGLFDPATWKITGSYDSFFPVDTNSLGVKAPGAPGPAEYFGVPSYAATQVVVGAVTKACADGKATRAEVRRNIALTKIPAARSVLGFRIVFQRNGELRYGGDGVFQIQADGTYKRVG